MRNLGPFAALVLGACSATVDPASYGVGGVGIANRSAEAVVIASQAVIIDLSNGEAGEGAIAGGILGGAANSGADAGGVVTAVLVGALVGAAIGASTESSRRTPGVEYHLTMETGASLTFIQPGGVVLPAGSRVRVLYGPPARLLPRQ